MPVGRPIPQYHGYEAMKVQGSCSMLQGRPQRESCIDVAFSVQTLPALNHRQVRVVVGDHLVKHRIQYPYYAIGWLVCGRVMFVRSALTPSMHPAYRALRGSSCRCAMHVL